MTQEEKELLLKDLCARLPYNVIVKVSKEDNGSIKSYNKIFDTEIYNFLLLNGGYKERGIVHHYSQLSLKPYLRPMSSMTKEEKNEISRLLDASIEINSDGDVIYLASSVCIPCSDYQIYIDYLNAHHFDYRGLIEKGLAIEAPEDMYNN